MANNGGFLRPHRDVLEDALVAPQSPDVDHEALKTIDGYVFTSTDNVPGEATFTTPSESSFPNEEGSQNSWNWPETCDEARQDYVTNETGPQSLATDLDFETGLASGGDMMVGEFSPPTTAALQAWQPGPSSGYNDIDGNEFPTQSIDQGGPQYPTPAVPLAQTHAGQIDYSLQEHHHGISLEAYYGQGLVSSPHNTVEEPDRAFFLDTSMGDAGTSRLGLSDDPWSHVMTGQRSAQAYEPLRSGDSQLCSPTTPVSSTSAYPEQIGDSVASLRTVRGTGATWPYVPGVSNGTTTDMPDTGSHMLGRYLGGPSGAAAQGGTQVSSDKRFW